MENSGNLSALLTKRNSLLLTLASKKYYGINLLQMKKNSLTKMATQTEINNALVNFFQHEEINTIIKYGIARLFFVFKIRYDMDKGIYGITMEDMIQETNTAFSSEKRRNWNKSRYPSFKKQYYSTFDSVISNTVKKYLEKANNHSPILDTDAYVAPDDHSFEEQKELLICELYKMGATDEEILLFEPYYIDEMKRYDIAVLMGLSVQEVTDIKKRLDRKLIAIGKKWKY